MRAPSFLWDDCMRMGGAPMATTEAEQIITRFVTAWERADVDELLDYFADDAIWHPMPMKPAVGKPALREGAHIVESK
jgi:ketosteroid isomerase-like protein